MDDMIPRAAAVRALASSNGDYLDALERIEKIPAVDAAPAVHSEWVEEPDRMGHYHCGNCGVVWGIAAKAMKYCPNCAAKMTNSPLWQQEQEAR